MSYSITEREYLEIDGVPLSTTAWWTRSLADLWSSPAMRGTDRIIPGADGVRTWPWRPTVTDIDLELDIVGDTDWEGNINADARAGLEANIAHLVAALVDAPASVEGLRDAVLHMPSGGIRIGEVRVNRLRIAPLGDWAAVGQLSLTLPAGRLVAST